MFTWLCGNWCDMDRSIIGIGWIPCFFSSSPCINKILFHLVFFNLFRCDLLVSRTPPWWRAPVSAATPTVCTSSRGHMLSYCSPSEVVCGEISHMRWWRQSWSGDVITCVRGCSTRSLLSRPNLWVSRGCWRRGRGLLRGCSAWCRRGPVVTSQDKNLLWRRAQRFYIF